MLLYLFIEYENNETICLQQYILQNEIFSYIKIWSDIGAKLAVSMWWNSMSFGLQVEMSPSGETWPLVYSFFFLQLKCTYNGHSYLHFNTYYISIIFVYGFFNLNYLLIYITLEHCLTVYIRSYVVLNLNLRPFKICSGPGTLISLQMLINVL